MKRLALLASIALLLSGCQSPLVATRSYSFDSTIKVNDKQYQTKTLYTCHHEDVTWISSRGKDWHIREGRDAVRAIGSLEDGMRFEILPKPKDWSDNFCPGQTEPVDVRLFVERDDSKVESFDRLRDLSTTHNVELMDTKISLISLGLAKFVDHHEWPPRNRPSKRYYTVHAIVYQSGAWKNEREIAALVNSKRILWLENGKAYPFSKWTENDVAFARLNLNRGSDRTLKLPLVPRDEDWVFSSADRNAIQWRLEPLPSSKSEEHELVPSAKFKRWIVFNDSRIEIPLRTYFRTFYQPEQDRLIEFRVEHVDLW